MKKLISALLCFGLLGGSSWAQTQVRRSSPQAPPVTASTFEKWDKRDAAHLLRRAGFGGSEADIQQIYTLGRTAAIDFLVNYENVENSIMDAKITAYDNPNPGLGLDVSKLQYGQYTPIIGSPNPVDTRNNYYLTQVERWWVFRMANSRKSLEEKLVLFWHDHFATGAGKVNDWQYMLWQNELLRAGASGNFRSFVTEVSKDPAMLYWLDNRLNRRGRPQENFARELMELFTIGIGNYTENDIRESAKAFTGWDVRNRAFYFNSGNHDTSNKTFKGVAINGLTGEQGIQEGITIIRLLTEHPVTARYMSEKLFEFFAYDDPSPDVIDRLAAVFAANKDQDDQIKKVVRAIFESPEFWSEKAHRSQVKSPIEYAVAAMKQLNAAVNWTQSRGTVHPGYASQQMGMRLLEPPDVAGWDWGTSWFNTATTLVRFNYANSVATTRLGSDGKVTSIYVDPAALIKDKNLVSADDVVDYFLGLMVESQVSDDSRYALTQYLQTDDAGRYVPFTLTTTTIDKKVRGLIYLIMIHPEYQMK